MKAKKITDIQWDVDIEDGVQVLFDMYYEDAAETLELPADRYANMTTKERGDYAYEYLRHSYETLLNLVGLPTEMDVPAEIADDPDYDLTKFNEALMDHLTDWLSDTYNYCVSGFQVAS